MAGKRRVTEGILEYVTLRVARRFLFTDGMLKRVGGIVPYYRTNLNEVDAGAVVARYERALARAGRRLPDDPLILEVGSGATNAVGYALAQSRMAGTGGRVLLHEPYATLDAHAERAQREALPPGVADRVRRITTLKEVAAGSVHIVLSHSVLEHVRDPSSTLAELDRVLAPGGIMLHAVDYRDHFFKYPFHFLLFSRRVWERWLDPGDLPRWRLGDHLAQLEALGLRAEVLEAESLPDQFERVAARLHPDFDRTDPKVAVAQATILVTRGA